MNKFLFAIALLALMLCSEGNLTITSSKEFVLFARLVESGTTYLGETVYLANDLDFSDVCYFSPVGSYETPFRGTFDGKGHVISNKHNNGQVKLMGLIGYITHGSVRNLVLDDTCTISTTFGTWMEAAYVGGIVGMMRVDGNTEFRLENLVNMANIYYDHKGMEKYIGGIVAEVASMSSSYAIKNCVNFGMFRADGIETFDRAAIGGIIGLVGKSTKWKLINCANYGTLEYVNTVNYKTVIGGLVGDGYYPTDVINCVNIGDIRTAAPNNVIAGNLVSNYDTCDGIVSYVRNSFWEAGHKYSEAFGSKIGDINVSDITDFDEALQLNQTVGNHSNLIDALNEDSATTGVSWAKVKYVISGGPSDGVIKLVPVYDKHIGSVMLNSGWNCKLYKDAAHTAPYNPSEVTVLDGLTVYEKCVLN